MKNSAARFILLLIVTVFTQSISAQSDVEKFRSILAMEPSQPKIESLLQFRNDYPESRYNMRAVQEIFFAYLELNNLDSALQYAHNFTQLYPEQSRSNAYNSIAYTLAEKNVGLDTALAYASRAVEMAENNPRYLNVFKDTKAYVLYKKGDAKTALDIQKEAIAGNENDPEYVYHLALYHHGVGNNESALSSAAWAVLHGDPGDALDKFIEWANEVDSSVKESIVQKVVQTYVDDMDAENQLAAKSISAAFMAQVNVNLPQTKDWMNAALQSIDKNTSVENFVTYHKNAAIVQAAEGNYESAKPHLEKVKDLADPWSGDFWLTLGNVYKNLSETEKAIEAYANGLIAMDNERIKKEASALISEDELKQKIAEIKDKLSTVNPGEFDESLKKSEKVVLAELFTGAECPPCVAADHAFDALAEYYPRTSLAILEYHAHIPGPDPLTNNKGWQRYDWYGGDFGTPTVFFEGKEQIIGGGPDFVIANRYSVYDHAIKKYLDENPEVEISGSANRDGNIIDLNFLVNKNGTEVTAAKPMFHAALVEKHVDYTGGNGVSKHIFVVRDLTESAEGSPVQFGASINRKIDVAEVEKTLKAYLDDPTNDPSWRPWLQFTGWRARTDEIDENNLAIIAWVQDAETKSVLQAYYLDVN